MNLEEQKVGHSLRVEIEQLEGGFVSNIGGKRRIYKDAHDIDDAINFKHILDNLKDGEYMLNLDVVPKAEYQDFLDGINLKSTEELLADSIEDDGLSILERAKRDGIIQSADKFNPMPNFPAEDNIHAPISVTAKTAYSSAKLKTIDWKSYDEQLPMTVAEKAEKCGINKGSMYNVWYNAVKGKAKFMTPDNRIAFTILAQYYEKNLGIRNNAKDKIEALTADMFAQLRELELMTAKEKYVKSTVLAVIIGKMRKSLLNTTI